MLTKKEKLLIRPWIVQRYENHRRKVQSATPAIDFRPPSTHPHITLKLKKVQRECERRQQIETENIRLLQKLGAIMNGKRIENFWQQSRPNFLNREFIYPQRAKTSIIVKSQPEDSNTKISRQQSIDNDSSILKKCSGTSARCPTCSGRPIKRNQVIPEERIPWPPQQKTINIHFLKQMSEKHVCCRYCC